LSLSVHCVRSLFPPRIFPVARLGFVCISAGQILSCGRNQDFSWNCRIGNIADMNSGDTAWLLVSTALVLLMVPGLALFYGGLVRPKNVLSTYMHSFVAMGLITLQWVAFGYSLAFGPDHGGSSAACRSRFCAAWAWNPGRA
jgi:hypothetical protein